MSCAAFEGELARVLAGEVSPAERPAAVERLKAHLSGCDACRGTGELVEWLELPEPEREIVDEPGEAYWEGFNGRLRERLRLEDARPGPEHGGRGDRAGRSQGWPRSAAVAAAVAALALAAWLVFPLPERTGASALAISETDPTAATTGADEEIPQELVELVDRTIDPDQGPAEEGWAAPADEGGSLFPDTEELDAESRRELLEWLREQTASAPEVQS